jgi:hypothetical protein
MFSEDIQLPVTSDETNERDRSVWNIINIRQSEFWGWQGRGVSRAAIRVVFVMEELKVLGLGSEAAIATNPLPCEESPIVGIIEALDGSITPWFSYGDEDHLDPQQKTESEDDAKVARVTIASSKTKFVVDLKKVWDAHRLPTANQAQSHSLVVFPSLRMKEDSVTVEVHKIERIETAMASDASWSKEVRLMDIVESLGLCEIGVFHSFGSISSFF